MITHWLFSLDIKSELIDTLQMDITNTIKSSDRFEAVDIIPIEELHMSLTRTLVLQHHWIDEFIRTIDKGIKNSKK